MTSDTQSVRERFLELSGSFDTSTPSNVHYEVREETRRGGLSFTTIIYEVDGHLNIPAVIARPVGESPGRLAIALHQSTRPPELGKAEPAGLGGRATLHYGRELAELGFGVICPDYPGFGTYPLDERQIYDKLGYESVTAKGLRNHIVAVSVLARFLGLDIRRVTAIGHSLGGSNAIFLALFDDRMSHVVCSAGFSDFRSYAEGAASRDLSGWARMDKYMPNIKSKFGLDHARMPVDFGEMIGSLAPKQVFCSLPRHDHQFDFEGAQRASLEAALTFERAGCPDHLVIATPNCGHDFPDAVRREAYSFLGCSPASFTPSRNSAH